MMIFASELLLLLTYASRKQNIFARSQKKQSENAKEKQTNGLN